MRRLSHIRARLSDSIEFRRRRRKGFDQFRPMTIAWLEIATAGMLDRGQYALIDRAIRGMPDGGAVLEIGSWAGLSTNIITHLLVTHERTHQFFTCDPWDFERGEDDRDGIPGSDVTIAALREHVKAQFVANTRLWSPHRLPHTIEASSDAFFSAWRARVYRDDVFGRTVRLGGPLAFVFIDGGHEETQVRNDIANAHDLLLPGGMMLLDDSDRFGGFPWIWKLGMSLVARGDYEAVGENPHLLLRKRRSGRGRA